MAVAEATVGARFEATTLAMPKAVAMSADVAIDQSRASRVVRASRLARASRLDTDCDASTAGIASRVMVIAGSTRNVRFIGRESSGAAGETGGNGRANAGEHLLTRNRAVDHGAILRRGIGVELDDLHEDVFEVLEKLAAGVIIRRR